MVAFCGSNIGVPGIRHLLSTLGPLRGMAAVYRYIDGLNCRDEIVDFICPSKYYAWNFRPSGTGRAGSIEFRRPPGVSTAKKATHWVAFTLSFIWMAMRFKSEYYIQQFDNNTGAPRSGYHPDFQRLLLKAADQIGESVHLDARLLQQDNPGELHITNMSAQAFRWLQGQDSRYRWSKNS